MHCLGGSPTFFRLGRKIVYCRADLDAWLDARRANNTSDADRLPRRLTDAASAASAADCSPVSKTTASRSSRRSLAWPA
jgi:hypothetical protein